MKASEYAQWVTDNKDKMEEGDLIKELGWKFVQETMELCSTPWLSDAEFISKVRGQDIKWSLFTKMVPELALNRLGYRLLFKLAFPETYLDIKWEKE